MDYRRVGRLWGRPHRVVGIGYRRASADGIRRSDVFWPCVRWIRDEREREAEELGFVGGWGGITTLYLNLPQSMTGLRV